MLMLEWFWGQLQPTAPGLWLLLNLLGLVGFILARPWLRQSQRNLVLLIRWLLIPYLGLISGGLSPRLLGLHVIDWLPSISLGIGIAFTVLATLLVVRAVTTFPLGHNDQSLSDSPLRSDWMHYPREWLISGAEEFHWAFLRGSLWELFLRFPTPPATPGYLAVWFATLLASCELIFSPWGNQRRWLKLVVLLATTILFFYSQNFWLCWFVHAAAWLILLPIHHQSAARTLATAR
jgi:hypothetical protein